MKRNLILLAAAAVCALFASCGKEAAFDDSEIWDAIADLKERVKALEDKVEANVSAIQSMVSFGSIASWEIDPETGKGVITLIGGGTVTIDQTIKGYSLMTVVEGEDGVWYWAVCRNGVSVLLEVDGKPVPVTVTPDLKISEDKEWLISVDGGKTWVNTGIEYITGEGSSDEDQVQFFQDVKLEGDTLILTLADGTPVQVAIVGEPSLSASADSMWFSRTAMEKSVALEMNNVKDYTITEVPDGWKARIEESYLYVTSPADFNSCPEKGQVKILALFEGGLLPEILSIEVAHEEMFGITRNGDSVTVTMSEHTGEDFIGYVLTGWKKAEYTEAKAAQWLNDNSSSLVPYEGDANYQVSEIVVDYSDDESYVIFAVPYLPAMHVAQGRTRYMESDIQAVSYKKAMWKVSDVRYDSAVITVGVDAEDGFYGGVMESSVWKNYGKANILEMLSYGGGTVCHEISYSGPAADFPYGEAQVQMIPSTGYVAWYIAYKEDGEYTEDDIVTYSFTTADVVADAAVNAPAYEVTSVSVNGFTADVTPAAGAYKTYVMAVKKAAVPESDDEIVHYLIKNGTVFNGNAAGEYGVKSLSDEDEVYLMAVSVTEDGGYGAIVKHKVVITPLEYTDAVSVNVAGIEYGLGTATLSLSFTGSPVSVTYMAASYTYYGDDTIQRLMALDQMGDAKTSAVSDLEDGTVTVDGLTNGAEYTFYAVVRDADGKASALYKYDFVPSISINYILKNDEDYEYGMPKMSGSWTSSDTYVLNVIKPASCRRFWLFKGNYEYFSNEPYNDTDKLITMQLMGTTIHDSSVFDLTYSPMNNTSRIYMAWEDDKGEYHQIYEYKPAK